jgi:hypothetical protein
VIEAGQTGRDTGRGNWLRERRLRLALLIGLVETVFVVWGGLGWFWVLAFAAAALALWRGDAGSDRRDHRIPPPRSRPAHP